MALNSQLYSFHVFFPLFFCCILINVKGQVSKLDDGLIVFAKIQLLAGADKVQGYNYSLFLNNVFKIHSGQNREKTLLSLVQNVTVFVKINFI